MSTLKLAEAVNIDGVDWPAGTHVVEDNFWARELVSRGAEVIEDTTPILTRIVPAGTAIVASKDLKWADLKARATLLGVTVVGKKREVLLAEVEAAEAATRGPLTSADVKPATPVTPAGEPGDIDPNAPETIAAIAELLGIELDAVAALPADDYAAAVARIAEAAKA